MNINEAPDTALDRLLTLTNSSGVPESRVGLIEAGRLLDPQAAEVICLYADTANPYGLCVDHSKPVGAIGRMYFARAVGNKRWIAFDDLPKATVDRLWHRINAGDFDTANEDSNGLALAFGQVRVEMQRALDCHFGASVFQIDEFKQFADGRFHLVVREDCSGGAE